MIPVVALTLLSLALIGALIHSKVADSRERQALLESFQQERKTLLDRIQNPVAAQAAAGVNLLPPPPPPEPEVPVYVQITDPDLQLLADT